MFVWFCSAEGVDGLESAAQGMGEVVRCMGLCVRVFVFLLLTALTSGLKLSFSTPPKVVARRWDMRGPALGADEGDGTLVHSMVGAGVQSV